MKIFKILPILVFIIVCITYTFVEGGTFTTLSDCLITNDIGIYSFDSESANIGKGSGVVGMAGHFNKDHNDTVCTGEYSNINEIRGLSIEEARKKILGVDVQVTQHAGSDSDKWLLHEVDKSFRTYYGIPGGPYAIRMIDGNTVMAFGSAGWAYRWLSDSKVINIEYTDLMMEKPEPLEVVKAYLAKHPSTLTAMTSADLRDKDNETKWIKDEMDRRLWLAGKWIEQIKTVGDLDELRTVVKNLNVFLDYREKYYGIKAAPEKGFLFEAQMKKDKASIEAKLNEYYKWWKENKDKAINL